MATRTQNCPNCGSSMNIQHLGAMQDKIWVCPSCGSTVDAPDHYQKIHRRQHVGPQGQHIYEEIHEIRSDDPQAAAFQQRMVQVQAPSIMTPPMTTGQTVKVGAGAGACACSFTGIIILLTVVLPLAIGGIVLAAVLFNVDLSDTPLDSLGIVPNTPDELPILREAVFENNNLDAIVYSPDGQRLITVGSPDEIVLWDANTYEQLAIIEADFVAQDVTFTADGSKFGFADGGEIKIYETRTGDLIQSLDPPGYYHRFLFMPNGEYALVAENTPDDSTLVLVSLDTFLPVRELGTDKMAGTFLFSKNGRYLFNIMNDSQISIWDLNNGDVIFRSKVPDMSSISAAAFSPDNQTLALGSGHTIQLYTLVGSELRKGKTFEVTDGVYGIQSLTFSPDAKYLVSGDFFGKALVWDIREGKAVYALENDDVSNYHAAFSPDGSVLVTGGLGDFLVFWEFGDKEPSASTEVAPPTEASPIEISSPASPPSDSETFDSVVATMNATSGNQLGSISTCVLIGKTSGVRIRAEASTQSEIQGTLASGAFADGKKQGSDGMTWYRLSDGSGWVREDVVEAPASLCSGLPTVQ